MPGARLELDRHELIAILTGHMATKKLKKGSDELTTFTWPLGRKNYLLLGISLVIIVIGYVCLGWGDDPNAAITLTVAPILLVLGYFMIPFAIMARDGGSEVVEDEGEAESTEAE